MLTSRTLRLALASGVGLACEHSTGEVPSPQDRAELVRFLTTMDHDMDLHYRLMTGKLAVRDDVPVPALALESHPVVEVGPDAIRYRDEPLDVPGLLAKLQHTHQEILDDIAQGHRSGHEDPVPIRERVILAIDAATPWQLVHDAIEAADASGFVEPVLLFARTPRTPPPPHTWVDDATAKDHSPDNVAAIIRKLLANCAPLRAAFELEPSDKPNDVQLLDALAAAIPRTDCAYDLPAFRSAIWNTIGNPEPHTLLAIRIDPAGQPLELAAKTPWREASASFHPAMPPLHLSVRKEP